MARNLKCIAVGLLAALGLAASAAETTLNVGERNGALRPFLGVNLGPLASGEAGNPDLTTAYQQQLGVTLIRTHDFEGPLDMATLYPDRSKDPASVSSYNFSQTLPTGNRSSDAVFASIVDNGFEPYFRLGDSWGNAKPPSESERANWVSAAVNVLKHYRQGQWNGRNSSFRYVEIWNEPDFDQFWPKPATPLQFFQLFDATAKALRAAFPELKIGGPGVTHHGCTSETGKRWVGSFLDYLKQQNTPLDFFSWHMYSNSPQEFVDCAAYYRQQLDSRGYTKIPTHLTEWNTDAERPEQSQAEKLALRTGSRGAALLTGAWIGLQKRDDVEQLLFYRGPDPSMDILTFYGLYFANGQPKTIALAWQLWRAITDYPHRLSVSNSQTDLHLLAAEKEDGRRALLIANTGANSQTLSARFADGKTLADYRIAQRSVTEGSKTIATTTPTTATLTLPGYSVHLVELSSTASDSEFAASASSSGPADRLSLNLEWRIAASDQGKPGSLFIAALAGEQVFLYDGQKWLPWSGGTLPAFYSGPLPASRTVQLLQNADTRGYSGIKLLIGYGRDSEDMLQRSLYRQVHQF